MKTSMQRNLIDLIHENTTITHLTAENHEQVIRALVDKLHEHGLVELEFADDVLAREETFPTGLPTEPHAVAIPHADPQHVRESAVAVAVLDRPVTFGRMGASAGTSIEAKVVFLLALKEAEKQVVMIQQLMELLQNASVLQDVIDAADSAQVVRILRDEVH